MTAEPERVDVVAGQVPLPGMPDEPVARYDLDEVAREFGVDLDDEDVEPCSMCGSTSCAEMCDDLPPLVPVITREPLARYL